MMTEANKINLDSPKTLKLSAGKFIFWLQIAAFWAVWRWLILRVWTSAEERWSLTALLAAIFFAFYWSRFAPRGVKEKCESQFSSLDWLPSVFFTLVYALSFAVGAPPLVRAILALTALTFTLSQWRFEKIFHAGIFGLLILSLPSVASLQFYLGYPLRVLVGAATAGLLRLQGLDVWREGVCLHFGEKLVWIDAPCSGVKMLWFGLFLAMFLACFQRLSNLKTFAVGASAVLIILLGNVFRAAALFYVEAEIFDAPDFLHEAVGVFSFLFVALGIAATVKLWRAQPDHSTRRRIFPDGLFNFKAKFDPQIFALIIFTAICALAFAAPFWFGGAKKVSRQTADSGELPTTFENLPLKPLPLTDREKFFLEDFPGSIGRFSDGRREIVIRRVTEATRKLHPAGDCFRAVGYETKPLPLKIDDAGNRWGCFSAAKAGENLNVCERIYDAAGGEWADVSAWYWSALNETSGEWWAITVAEKRVK